MTDSYVCWKVKNTTGGHRAEKKNIGSVWRGNNLERAFEFVSCGLCCFCLHDSNRLSLLQEVFPDFFTPHRRLPSLGDHSTDRRPHTLWF